MKSGKPVLAIILATLAIAFTGTASASGNNNNGDGSNQTTPLMQCLAAAIENGTDPEACQALANTGNGSSQSTPIMQCLANAIANGADPEPCKALANADNQAVDSPVMKCLADATKNNTNPMLCRMYTDPTPDPEVEQAAGAIVCLTRLMTASTKPVQCTKYVHHYLSIADFDAGVFDPHDTYEERGDFLNKCKKCRRNDIRRVQLTYGYLPPTADL